MNNFSSKVSTSFARRLSIYVCAVAAVLFIFAASGAIIESAKHSTEDAEQNAFSQLDIITLQIEGILDRTSSAVDNLAFAAEGELSKKNPDREKLFHLTRRLVEENESVVGSIVALSEYYMDKDQKYFAAYSIEDDNGNIQTSNVGNVDYDYHTMDWYLVPKLLDSPYWTDPYFDEGAGNIMMCTYSRPLKDPDGNFLGVLTADIPLGWLSGVVNQIKPYKSSYNLMIGKDASYIVHTDPDRILKETIFTATANMEDQTVYTVGKEMLAGRRSYKTIDNDDTTSVVFYTPIPKNGWSVAMVCPNRDIYENTGRLVIILGITMFVALVILFLLVYFVITKMMKPLQLFSESAGKIAEGDFNAPLPKIKYKDEMYRLRESFRYMQTSLTDYIDKLKETTSIKEHIESELNIAREIQMSMVPKTFPAFPGRSDIDIYASMQTAREVGGDLYDFFIEDDKLYFAVGDVSGKGVPASLFMAVTRSIFRSVAASAASPGAIISAMNNAMCDGNDANMFVTVFVGIVNLSTLEMIYSNAGHNPPILIRNNDAAEFIDVDSCTGIPIGLFENQDYSDSSMKLSCSDTLVLYTDGLTEAENKSAELYGDDRLLSVLSKEGTSSLNVRNLLENLLADVEGHVAGAAQSDDLTVMVMKFFSDNSVKPELELEEEHSDSYRRIVLRNEISQLTPMAEWIETTCGEFGASPSLTMSINLALEEAVANVIMYAYPDNGVSANFFVDFDKDDSDVATWRIVDSGKPFDPTAKKDADLSLDVMERPIGGLGIYMLKEIMDEVSYKREDGQNILIMKINLKK